MKTCVLLGWVALVAASVGCAEGDGAVGGDRQDGDAGLDGGPDANHGSDAAVRVDAGGRDDGAARVDAAASDDAGASADDGGRTCQGDHWAQDEAMLARIAECTTITGNLSVTSKLVSISLPKLVSVEGFLTVWENTNLTRFEAPLLTRTGRFVDISSNPVLRELSLPKLESANAGTQGENWDLAIFENPALPACQAEAIRDGLLTHGFTGRVKLADNGSGTCAP
jgi:hypothetical protein